MKRAPDTKRPRARASRRRLVAADRLDKVALVAHMRKLLDMLDEKTRALTTFKPHHVHA